MNFKFFFVKDFHEFLKFPDRVLDLPQIKNSPELRAAVNLALSGNQEAVYYLYRELIFMTVKTFHGNIETLYEGNIFFETGLPGLKLDFNFGLRLDIPRGNFHVKISDFESETIFFDEDISDCRLVSSDFYYIKWHIEIFLDGEKIFDYIFNPENQNVFFVFTAPAIGDSLALLPYVREFQKVHRCKIFIWVREYLRELLKNLYPEFVFVEKITQEYYATFYFVFLMGEILSQPADTRTLPLEKIGGMLLGLENSIPSLPKFFPTEGRKIPEKYVCIACQASGTLKSWLYPGGWEIVCDYLKKLGYRVCCIDKNEIQTENGYTVKKPKNAENFCGNIPLLDRANMLYYAEFFIGLGSGLSWLANAVGCEVILISGFSETWCEFETPYRIKNNFVCGGCYNDVRNLPFAADSCPHYRGTEREMECQKKISPRQVISAIDNLIADKNLQPPNFWKYFFAGKFFRDKI